ILPAKLAGAVYSPISRAQHPRQFGGGGSKGSYIMLTAPSKTLPRDEARRPLGLLRFVQRNPTLAGGGLLFGLMVLIAVAAPYGGTVDPQELNPIARLRPPSVEHWFGTDMLGRDLYSRTLYGSRISLLVGLCVAALSMTIGLLIGLISGY